MSMFIGEALVGEGNEIAHIDLLIGSKDGPVGAAFANALARQSEGHTNLLAVLTPNLAVKPATVMVTKVTIKGAKQAVQMFGPAQAAVAKAVADSVADGVIPKGDAENLVIVCGVFIHWDAADDKKIYNYNYEATKMAIANAMKGKPSVDEMVAGKEQAGQIHHGADDNASGTSAILAIAKALAKTPRRRHLVVAFWSAASAVAPSTGAASAATSSALGVTT